jgi:hypothetical protein
MGVDDIRLIIIQKIKDSPDRFRGQTRHVKLIITRTAHAKQLQVTIRFPESCLIRGADHHCVMHIRKIMSQLMGDPPGTSTHPFSK